MSKTVSALDQLEGTSCWFEKAISRSIGSKTASIYSDKFKSQAADLLTTNQIENGEEAFLRVYRTFCKDVLGPLIFGWAVTVLKTFEYVRSQVDRGARLWWLPRDAYPGMWVAELIAPMIGIDAKVNQAVHINRVNLGIKNEIDVEMNDQISKTPKDFICLKKYIQQNIGQAKVVVIADSLQYAYIIEALYKGSDSFIIKMSNGADIWKNDRMPKEVIGGFIPRGVTLLPVSFYSHLSGPEFGETVFGYLNYLSKTAGYDLRVTGPIKPRLEALADAVEAIICDHEPVRNFKATDKGLFEPNIIAIKDSLASKFTQAARDGITSAAYRFSSLITQGDWHGFISEQIRHLNYLLNEFEKVNYGGLALVVKATAPRLSKRRRLFSHVLDLNKRGEDWLGTKWLAKYIFRPEH